MFSSVTDTRLLNSSKKYLQQIPMSATAEFSFINHTDN